MQDGAPGEWVLGAAAGDQQAWTRLVDRYNPMLGSIARSFRLNSHEAGDVVQTTWLQLVQHLDRVKEPDRIGSWLAVTARHECLGLLRRQSRHGYPNDDLSEVVDPRAAPDQGLLVEERDSALWSALQAVSERCQQLLRVLACDPPPSYREVSAALDMPVGSIGPIRARCLDALRREISELAPEHDLLGP